MSEEIDKMWNFADPKQSEAKFQEALRVGKASGGDAYCAELLTQIARAQGLQKRFEDGHRTLEEAISLAGSKAPDRLRARILLERGRLYNSARDVASAAPLFREAIEAAQTAPDDYLAIDAAHMLGICQPPEEATQWNLRAIGMAEKSTNPRARKWLGSLLNNLAWTYHDRQEYTMALELFQKALAYRESLGRPTEIGIAKWCVARTLRSLGRYQEALAIQENLRDTHKAAGTEDACVYEELGELYHIMERPADAQPWFKKAYENLSQDASLVESEPSRFARMKELAGI